MRLKKDTKVDLLRGVPLFAGCSKTELQRIASLADELDLAEGAMLIREGERGREFLVVVSGTVSVTKRGKKITDLGAGDFIGEIALVSDVPRTATVTATSPVRLLVVTDRAFRGLIEEMPSIATKVLQVLGERPTRTPCRSASRNPQKRIPAIRIHCLRRGRSLKAAAMQPRGAQAEGAIRTGAYVCSRLKPSQIVQRQVPARGKTTRAR